MTIDLERFTSTLGAGQPPSGFTSALQALWWDAKGDWDKAHKCVDSCEDEAGMRVHAYLHRKEGDLSNAAHWYRRAGRTAPGVTLDAEHKMLLHDLLGLKP